MRAPTLSRVAAVRCLGGNMGFGGKARGRGGASGYRRRVLAVFAGVLMAGGWQAAALAGNGPDGGSAVAAGTVAGTPSSNWAGYFQNTLEQGGTIFNQVSADWAVPSVTQHATGQAEHSATWVGIGGGCEDPLCATDEPTLIQAGTEQDVSASGTTSYYAWTEVLPLPQLPVTTLAVRPGDSMHVDIRVSLPPWPNGLTTSPFWIITITDQTTGASYTATTAYFAATTAEWIEETPLEISGASTGIAAMPNLIAHFSNAMRNNAPAGLKTSEEIYITDNAGNTIATPSAPDSSGGFDDCMNASTCA